MGESDNDKYNVNAWRRRCLAGALAFASSAVLGRSQPRAKRSYLVAYAQDSLAIEWRAAQMRQMQAAFQRHPEISFEYSLAEGETAKQVADVEDWIARRVDVLIVSPRDNRALAPVIGRAYRMGIPVILATRRIVTEDYTTFITPDDRDIGRAAANFIAKTLHGRGRVLMVQGVPTTTTAIGRTEGFVAGLGRHPGVRLVATKVANYLRGEAVMAIEEVLAEKLEFDAVYAQSDAMASGVRLALGKAGIDPGSKTIVGIDYSSEARAAILAGKQTASFVYPTCAEEVAAAVVQILAGRKLPRRIEVASRLVTRDNAEAVEATY